jgi:aryl-alcohol dehydrogenase-like predicted oxidoreductase
MRYAKLGKTDLEVSVICLGTWVFGGHCWGDVDDKVSERVVAESIDKGINFIDTAPIYGNGRSEEVIGRAIKGKRDGLVIATKCGLKIKGRGLTVDLSAEFIRKETENSLKRLGIETIDLYQCHWPSDTTPYKETFGELNKMLKEGKIKHIGISNFDKKQTKKAMEYAPIATNQVQYSLLDRRIEIDLEPFCEEEGISILPYGALGGGILTGKYKEPPKIAEDDVKDFFYKFYKEPEWSKAKALVAVLEDIAARRAVPVSQVAVNWVLSHASVQSCIAGCRTPEQADLNVGAAGWKLSEEELGLIQCEYKKVFGG